MANKTVDQLTTISGAGHSDYFVMYDASESADEKLKKLPVSNFIRTLEVDDMTGTYDVYVDSVSGDDDTGDGSSGSPYETLEGAAAKFKNTILDHNEGWSNLTFKLAKGTYNVPYYGFVPDPMWRTCKIVGTEPVTGRTITSIQSSSGSAGDWSYVLNVSSVTGITAGEYILISDTGGVTDGERLGGCWKITNVDSGNTRLTINVTDWTTSALSGSLTGDFCVLNTIVTGSYDVFVIENSNFTVGDLVCVPPSGGAGIRGINNADIKIWSTLAGFGINPDGETARGVYLDNSFFAVVGGMSSMPVGLCGCSNSIAAWWGSVAQAMSTYEDIYCNGTNGVSIQLAGSSYIHMNGVHAHGSDSSGMVVSDNSMAYCSNNTGLNVINASVNGVEAQLGSFIRFSGAIKNATDDGLVANYGSGIYPTRHSNDSGETYSNNSYIVGY